MLEEIFSVGYKTELKNVFVLAEIQIVDCISYICRLMDGGLLISQPFIEGLISYRFYYLLWVLKWWFGLDKALVTFWLGYFRAYLKYWN